MSDDNQNDRGGQGGSGGGRAPLTLKPRTGSVSAGTVRQSFSHGRSKTVVVETKRRAPRPEGERPIIAAPARPAVAAPAPAPRPPQPPAPAASSANLNLSQSELAARQKALEAARAAEERRAAAEAARQAEEARARREAEPVPAPAPALGEPAPVVAAPAAPAPVAEAPAPAPAPVVEAAPPAPPVAAPATPAPEPERPIWERLSKQDRPAVVREPRTAEDRARPAPRPDGAGARPARDGAPAYGDRAARPSREGAHGEHAFRDRSPRPEGGAYGAGARGPRSDAGGGGGGFGSSGPRPPGTGGYGTGAPRPRPEGGAGGYGGARSEGGDTVRYSALSPRPAPRAGPGGARPGGPGLRGAGAAPSAPEITKTTRSAPPRAGERRPLSLADDDEGARRKGAALGKAVSRTKGEPKRREGRLTIQAAGGDEDSAERMRSLASVRRAREREREKRAKGVGGAGEQRITREVVIPDAITVQDLAQRMATRAVDIIKYMMRQGAMMTINDVLDADTAELIATEFGHDVKRVSESDVEQGFLAAEDDAGETHPRPPVVAVMGHVDHGKTSLLDALRSADVAGGEHGGITQHIGAYQVRLEGGERVTFLDTPGHAAFSAMRARGANVTDIVVLVVAADDGVMPQTIEAINHAKAAGAPIIVAINKIDKPDANPQKVINELLQHEIVVESLGGDTQAIEVSATKKLGLDNLIEAILLQAEVMDLRANSDRSGEGVVIEAKLDKGRGPVATVLVKRGTLKRGDIVVAGAAWGRVRALINERDEQVAEAGPSVPVEILGLDSTPEPGEPLAVVENEARARELTEYRTRLKREKTSAPLGAASLADMMAKLQTKKVSELPVIIKADVQGSAEAIVGSLDKLATDEVRARIILSGAGAITESDVQLAKGSNSPILGFNVRASKQARDLAEREGVEIRYYAIIYDLIDDIKGVLSGMLAPLQRETFLGNAEVLQVFDITKVGKVAGCRVSEGVVRKGAKVRIIRQDVVVLELGTLQTLKRFKDEVNEVNAGQECGMHFQGFQDIRAGDTIECFTVETVARSL
ncbi:MAG TPA: translation initiation factor IF-2 [Caulobacteraceae bacterium]|nr:translation initiation factor IF-2 [Caulobacteraceae bacterium]